MWIWNIVPTAWKYIILLTVTIAVMYYFSDEKQLSETFINIPGVKLEDNKFIINPNVDINNLNLNGRLYFKDKSFSEVPNGSNASDPYYLEKVVVNGGSHLRLTMNDATDESMQIWGNSCKSVGGCGGPGARKHMFSASGDAYHTGNLIFDGTNGWIFHTPHDGRKTLYIAPKKDKDWDWGNQIRVEPDGRVVANRLQLGNKFVLSGVGDQQANDQWLRLVGTDGAYYGGLAAGSLWTQKLHNASDRNLKMNIESLDKNDVDDLDKLKPVKYEWKNETDKKQHYGFIAQDIEKVYPNMVMTDTNATQPIKAVNYTEVIPIVVGKLQRMKTVVQTNKLCIDDVCITKKELIKMLPKKE